MFPRKFGRYIEIFGGSGAVLLGKEPSKFEVYNDIEGELVNFFRVVKNRPAELLLELDLILYTDKLCKYIYPSLEEMIRR